MNYEVDVKITLKCNSLHCKNQEIFEQYGDGDEEDCWANAYDSGWVGNTFVGFYCSHECQDRMKE